MFDISFLAIDINQFETSIRYKIQFPNLFALLDESFPKAQEFLFQTRKNGSDKDLWRTLKHSSGKQWANFLLKIIFLRIDHKFFIEEDLYFQEIGWIHKNVLFSQVLILCLLLYLWVDSDINSPSPKLEPS